MKASSKNVFKEGSIVISGARVHNLKNIHLSLPRNKFVVITGLSGSGKSSLAFDTLYAEGQRRYVESLSSYARQFLGVMDKPDVDNIEGLSPAISIDQKSVSSNPRSTVGTITEIHDYLRLLFARVGEPHCPQCGRPVVRQSSTQVVDRILKLKKGSEIAILAPLVKDKKGEHKNIIEHIAKAGYRRARVNGETMLIEEAQALELDRHKKHTIEAVVDRLAIESGVDRPRLADSVETALRIGEGWMVAAVSGSEDLIFSENFACAVCGISLPEIEPRNFSFNSPHGACAACSGLGKSMIVDPELLIPNPRLSIAEGAVKAMQPGGASWSWLAIEDLAGSLGFSLNTPVEKLSKETMHVLLYGGTPHHFEGITRNLERRWRETDSDWIRGEIEKYMIVKRCVECGGKRLKKEMLSVLFHGKNIADVSALSVTRCREFFRSVTLGKTEQKIASQIIKEAENRLRFLEDVGLEYLSLDRESETLSGGEAQRIRLATQIGSRLVGVLYILDEPSIGLHARDNARLIGTLKGLRDLGNTVVVVEHDKETMLAADWVVEIGPGAGAAGGKVVFEGTPQEMKKAKTLTGQYLSGAKNAADESLKIKQAPAKEHKKAHLEIKGAQENNLKNIDVKIPLAELVCITGVSGSGKSTLVDDILAKALAREFYDAKAVPGKHKTITGIEHINKVIHIDQSPIGRTPRSNPATYTGVFTVIRTLFAQTQEAKVRGYKAGRFSFNVKGGRCEVCEGQGQKKIEMHFLPDVYVECEECYGTRFNKEALEVEFKGKTIAAVLAMSVDEAHAFFEHIPTAKNVLSVLKEVGLGYIKLGQSATTLSGGEAQRIKLANELARRDTGLTLYILDEPTTGLHFEDVSRLLVVLRRLVNKNNTVLVIEHNMDVIAGSDWIIDLGHEGGDKGGELIASGTPADVARNKKSYTGQFLRDVV
ncbi:excinuclease ABC subunit A [Candidatus Azambacteria bacterium RIFCSPLOWO2_01_FULL_46_25]|uniref:UvrABC system protein A n=1 Tax=Candidatus Azambacteria bacterium RIFCSPLOWO2_01_FULL_46_25 TaxID=1797298 RepID=A0A1F5BTR8_9BACT|nr:MAG: excinuclease ABC subunit A [Candidatus Azambacteria bacterium RIFCSPLOWO2_01_FULL_46_25]OGD36549.1 MAG: excinuclease ABC subunit A [Candidatus Azambacteria bacterium RIFCSPHIGHO2_01_FULL_51_74]